MKIRCLAIDDEPLALQQLAAYIERTPFLQLVKSCHSALEAVEALAGNEPIDAIFIDINMPDMSGLDFVKSLPAPPLVVFTTAYEEYAIDSYKVGAIDYLLKPFGFDEFNRAALKVQERYTSQRTAQVSSVDDDDSMFLKTEYKIVRINVRDISHVEAMSEYLRIYLVGARKPIIVLLSMKRMEERLSKVGFMRVHRSYIINLKKIVEVSKNRILLDENIEIPIGDSYREDFMDYINSKFLSK